MIGGLMIVIKFLLISSILLVFVWAGISKIILEELGRHCRTYQKIDTLYYRKLQDLQSRISITPSFLWEATRLILDIEKEEKEEKSKDRL